MYRRAGFQKQLGLPLADSTQWGLTKIVDGIAHPVFDYLVKTAAQGSLFYIDDTWVRILAIIKANKEATCKKIKKACTPQGLSHMSMAGGLFSILQVQRVLPIKKHNTLIHSFFWKYTKSR